MEIRELTPFGPHLNGPKGWIAQIGTDNYNHRFGGKSWKTLDSTGICEPPTLLINLDLNDPKLLTLRFDDLDELPLCYSINCDALVRPQRFQIEPKSHTITLIEIATDSPERLPADGLFPIPLHETRVSLRPMEFDDYPTDIETYDRACERFVGGNSFIRIMGPPLWLQSVEVETCTCGSEMIYVASIGYESSHNPTGFIPGGVFFLGEAALYFFLCKSCLTTMVISQST